MGSLYVGFTHESYCLKVDKTTIPFRHLRRSIFACKNFPNLFAFSIFLIYINSQIVVYLFYFTVEAH